MQSKVKMLFLPSAVSLLLMRVNSRVTVSLGKAGQW